MRLGSAVDIWCVSHTLAWTSCFFALKRLDPKRYVVVQHLHELSHCAVRWAQVVLDFDTPSETLVLRVRFYLV